MIERFFGLVDRLNAADPAERGRIEADIWQQFGVERAVLALDMSHFSLTVRRDGIVGYLGLIRRMQLVSRPLVEAHDGALVEFHADNLMAVFPDVPQAVHAGIAMNRAFARERDAGGRPLIEVGIGIDHGRFLFVEGSRCFGDSVNTSFKLGEDLAQPGEILLTANARERLPRDFPNALTEHRFSISGLELLAYNVHHLPAKP
ncbi:MAG TPA: adenylate/guanylate cyclase domain-containing protein [Usitatibacter sp.]|nr:adenylate/guanylate cyclase domain-containing protein [Usitatibacter sp.]